MSEASFAKSVSIFCKSLPKTIENLEYVKQVIRSSGSVGANYIEANESLGKKDFMMRIRICIKEAKESGYWLKLLRDNNDGRSKEFDDLIGESNELRKIFAAILNKSS